MFVFEEGGNGAVWKEDKGGGGDEGHNDQVNGWTICIELEDNTCAERDEQADEWRLFPGN